MPMVGSIKNVGSFHRRLEARWKLRILSNLMGDPESFIEFHMVEGIESGGLWTTWRGTTIIGKALCELICWAGYIWPLRT